MSLFTTKVQSLLPQLQDRMQCEPAAILPFEREYPRGHLIERHSHQRDQLVYAVQGVMRIDTDEGIWVVPPMRAVWMPAGIEHEIRTSTPLHLHTLFIRPDVRQGLPTRCCVVEVTPLLRELILRLVRMGTTIDTRRADAILELVLAEIEEFNVLPLHIPMPSDTRLLKICHKILADPSSHKTCAQWGTEVGASARTLERLFLREVGISFGAWRRQVRLLAALDHLAGGASITTVAMDLGYRSPSAFTVMFKRALGQLPSAIYN